MLELAVNHAIFSDMVTFRVVQGTEAHRVSGGRPGWFVERTGDGGDVGIIGPLFEARRDAESEAQRLTEQESENAPRP